jgi:hypothetical protein
MAGASVKSPRFSAAATPFDDRRPTAATRAPLKADQCSAPRPWRIAIHVTFGRGRSSSAAAISSSIA